MEAQCNAKERNSPCKTPVFSTLTNLEEGFSEREKESTVFPATLHADE